MKKRIADMTPDEREKRRAYDAAYRAANLVRINATRAAWRAKTFASSPTKVLSARAKKASDRGKAWRAANYEKARAGEAARKVANREKALILQNEAYKRKKDNKNYLKFEQRLKRLERVAEVIEVRRQYQSSAGPTT